MLFKWRQCSNQPLLILAQYIHFLLGPSPNLCPYLQIFIHQSITLIEEECFWNSKSDQPIVLSKCFSVFQSPQGEIHRFLAWWTKFFMIWPLRTSLALSPAHWFTVNLPEGQGQYPSSPRNTVCFTSFCFVVNFLCLEVFDKLLVILQCTGLCSSSLRSLPTAPLLKQLFLP